MEGEWCQLKYVLLLVTQTECLSPKDKGRMRSQKSRRLIAGASSTYHRIGRVTEEVDPFES